MPLTPVPEPELYRLSLFCSGDVCYHSPVKEFLEPLLSEFSIYPMNTRIIQVVQRTCSSTVEFIHS